MMTWATKTVTFEVPDCIAPYNWAPIYIWSSFGALLLVLAAITAISIVSSNNRKDRRLAESRDAKELRQTEIRNTHNCPTCGDKVVAGGK